MGEIANDMNWNQSETWKRAGKNFAVEIKHWTAPYDGWAENHWNVYVYFYPQHPHFARFDGERIYQPAADALPLHGGATYLHSHYDHKGEVKSIQVGSDYDHAGDEKYSRCASPSEAAQIFADAETLFTWCTK